MYEIEDDVPMTFACPGRSRYPFAEMMPKQSFFVPGGDELLARVQNRVANAAKRWAEYHDLDWRFRTSMDRRANGVRVWRVA